MDETALAAETLLAAVGLLPILKGKPKLPAMPPKSPARQLRTLIDRFLARPGVEPLSDIPDFDYDEVVKLLDGAGTEAQVGALFDAIPSHELGDAVKNRATGMITALQQGLPRAGRQEVWGTTAIRPREMAIARYARTWSVANDPMIVLRDLTEGSLTSDMVEAFTTFWPAFYAASKVQVLDAIAELRTKRPTWELEPRRDRLLRMFMGVPALNLELAADLQKLYAAQAQKPPAPKKSAPGTEDKAGGASPLLTPGQES
jgi:hypothetical protein